MLHQRGTGGLLQGCMHGCSWCSAKACLRAEVHIQAFNICTQRAWQHFILDTALRREKRKSTSVSAHSMSCPSSVPLLLHAYTCPPSRIGLVRRNCTALAAIWTVTDATATPLPSVRPPLLPPPQVPDLCRPLHVVVASTRPSTCAHTQSIVLA